MSEIANPWVEIKRLEQVIVNLMGAREIAGDDGCDVTASCSECGNINRYQSLASVELEELRGANEGHHDGGPSTS